MPRTHRTTARTARTSRASRTAPQTPPLSEDLIPLGCYLAAAAILGIGAVEDGSSAQGAAGLVFFSLTFLHVRPLWRRWRTSRR